MKRANRIRKSKDFQRIRREGKSISRAQVVYISHSNDHESVQIGISAGRSVGNAVKRNRAKRILRAAMNPLIDKVKPGREIVLIARKPILKETSTSLQEIIERLAQESSDLIKQ